MIKVVARTVRSIHVKQNAKTFSLLALCAVLIAVILLGGSLSNLELQLGAPIPEAGEQVDSSRLIWDPPAQSISIPVIRGFLALVFLILFIYVCFRILTLVNRKIILQAAVAAALVLILLAILPKTPQDYSGSVNLDEPGVVSQPSSSYEFASLGEPPPFLQWLVAGGAGLGLVILAYRMLRLETHAAGAEVEIRKEAELAVQALQAGQRLENVILRCYEQMSQSLRESQGIERDHAMTVGEFGASLKARGFPADPVQRLSALFEIARYGNLSLHKKDEALAIESLSAIIEFCKIGSEV
jgi:hypothetical protein